jgi:hypothetical protein
MPIANFFISIISDSLKHVKYHDYDPVSKPIIGLRRRITYDPARRERRWTVIIPRTKVANQKIIDKKEKA